MNKGLLRDEDVAFLPSSLDTKIIVPYDLDIHETIVACNITFRLGLEALNFKLPLAYSKRCFDKTVNNPIFKGRVGIEIYCQNKENQKGKINILIKEIDNKNHLYINSRGQKLQKNVQHFAQNLPLSSRNIGFLVSIK